ncbi:aldehyde dehydrogenase family protein [Patescibacteria group bacterium]
MMDKLISYSPTNGKKVGETIVSTQKDVEKAVSKAKTAFQLWKNITFSERTAYAKELVKLLKTKKEEIAKLTTFEMGKPIQEARDDITYELDFINWYASNIEEILREKVVHVDENAVYKTIYEPYGVCASIAPWNFPITMASTGIVAQVLAGNTVVFKPSEHSTLSQKMFVDLFNQAGLPDGVLQCVMGDSSVGKKLIDSDIDLVWFTGSTAVGQEIYKKCADKLIRCLLELGGSSPGIVLADCDFEKTMDAIYFGRFFNNGQVCTAVKRLFVEKPIFEKAVKWLVEKVKTVKVGDPTGEVDFGPLVSQKQLDTLISQVEDARNKGANIIVGGDKPNGKDYEKGNYYLPTVVTGVTKDMRIYKEEVFGPVLPVMSFSSEKEVVELANDTPYGLSAEIYTGDNKKARRVADKIEAGGISINMNIAFLPQCPIGGYKKSGIGREYGEEGIKELAQLKYISVAK